MSKRRKKRGIQIPLTAIIVAGLVLFLAYKGFNTVWSKIIYGRTRIKTRGLHADATMVGLKVQVIQPITNENNISFPLDALSGQVFYGRSPLAVFQLPAPMVIQANETVELIFDGILNFGVTADAITNIISTGDWLRDLRFEGTATSAGITFPFENTISIG
jgi:hypothetical protein